MASYSVTISTDGTPGAYISYTNSAGNGPFGCGSSTPITKTGYDQSWRPTFTMSGVNGCKARLQFSSGQWAGSYTEMAGTTFSIDMMNMLGIEVIACNVGGGGGTTPDPDPDPDPGNPGPGDPGGSDTWVLGKQTNLSKSLINVTDASYYCYPGEYFLVTFGCKYSGNCVISVQEQMGESVFCFIADIANFNSDSGYPDDFIAIATSGGSSTLAVTAGVTYYIYARLSSIDDYGTAYISIAPPGDPSDPNNANGVLCVRLKTGEWKVVTPYVYIDGEWEEAKACLRGKSGW